MPKGNKTKKNRRIRDKDIVHVESPSVRRRREEFSARKRQESSLAEAVDQTTQGIIIGKKDRRFEESQAQIAAKSMGLPYINLFGFPVELAALKLIKKEEAEKADAAPFVVTEDKVRLATVNATNPLIKDMIKRLKKQGYDVRTYFVSPSSFKHVVGFYENVIGEKPIRGTRVQITEKELKKFRLSISSIKELQKKAATANTTEVMDLLVAAAIQLQASDIHLEPASKDLRVRYRIDGMLHDAAALSIAVHKQLLSRIKLLAKLKLNITNVAQDGRFSIETKERKIDVRVSVLPTQYGESVVMRLLGLGSILLEVKNLGLRDYSKEVIDRELKKPNGMILTTGPTGSGKTTTLYSFINEFNAPSVKIITLEDPIEYRLTGIEQTQVEEAKGYTFARGLRSILRQDPDVLLVGEIRDLETAETAVSAALTGHIVFSTLHTNDAAGALPRLIDMGVRPFVLAPAINAVIAQRLVRRICQSCFKEYPPSKTDKEYIKAILGPELVKRVPDKFTLVMPQGCEECNFIGYKGRIGVFEVFRIDDAMEQLILSAAGTSEIRESAIDQGMILMKQDGIFKALGHITTLEEVERVV